MPSSASYRNSLGVPNGGFGWFVVFGTALTNVFNQSLVSVFGLLYGKKIIIALEFIDFGIDFVICIFVLQANTFRIWDKGRSVRL